MATLAAGSTVSVYCPLTGTMTVTPGTSGRVSINARGQDGSQSLAPRELYTAETLSVTAGDVVLLEAINVAATYTEPAQSGGGGASAFTDLTDKATADLPVINTPLGSALAAKAPLASPTFTGTVGGITKSMVGLGSVDNTADTAKPVSTAQTAAFAVLGPYASAGALETAKPAASNGGRLALVGASAPYAPYMSDGTTWGSLSQSGGDPYVAIATSGSSQSINIGSAGVVDITLTANCTLSFTGAVAGAAFSLRLILRQDSTGTRSVTWPAGTKWSLGAAPTLSTPANSIDEVVLMTYDGGTSFFGDFVARARA